jgi:hypothetical protein
MTETRHSHGGVQHDHEGGEIPHGHSDPPSREPEHRPGNGASAAFGFGTVLAVFGGLGMLWQSNNHSACSSVLVQAVSQSACQQASAVWTLGIISLVLGTVLLIIGAILRGKS